MWLSRQGVFALLLLGSGTAQASIFGEENISLAKMITQLEAMYTKMVQTVEEAKAQNATLSKMNDVIKSVKEEKDAVENTFLRNIDEVFRRDLEGVTELYAFSGVPMEQTLSTLRRELERRLSNPLLEDARQQIESQ